MNRKVGIFAILAAITLIAATDQVEAKCRLFNRQCNCCEKSQSCEKSQCTCGCNGNCVCSKEGFREGYRDGYQDGQANCSCEFDIYGKKGTKGAKKFWPFTDGDDPVDPAPAPDAPVNPAPAPEPLPEPPVVPDNPQPSPTPDPAPLPPNPAPAPANPVVIPTDHAELCKYVAPKLGGYSRANYDRNGCTIDIYQARGKQRIAWAVADGSDWKNALVAAFISKSVTGSSNAGVVLVCHCPDNPTPPPVPVDPAPPLPVPDPAGPVQRKLYKFGGPDLVSAEAVCRAAGLWLCIVCDKTGEVNRVIYGNVPAQKVTWKAAKKSKK